MKGKALRRALVIPDAIRVGADLPLITDTTELITPEVAQEMLRRNKHNRVINWRKVEEYATAMTNGEWRIHGQGIIVDVDGNVMTGQKRLWAVVFSGVNVYMRVSRGNPPDVATLIDRGDPQTARDLASRRTERRHSPTESSIARAYSALMGNVRPSVDELAEVIALIADDVAVLLEHTKGTKKTKPVIMILGALIAEVDTIQPPGRAERRAILARAAPELAAELEARLLPHTPGQYWNKGAAFGLAMEKAAGVVSSQRASSK